MITMATDSTEMTGFHLGTFMFCQVGNEVCVNFSVFFKPDGQNPLFGQPWLKRRRIKRKWKMDPVFEKIQQGFLSEFRNKEYQVNCGILYIENMNTQLKLILEFDCISLKWFMISIIKIIKLLLNLFLSRFESWSRLLSKTIIL